MLMKLKNISFPLLIILVGVLFSLYLQGQIADGVYFSGDAGLKALLAQQLSRGEFRFDLIPPTQTWVNNLWQDGLYPYEEPFVYNVENKYYITFPYTFPLVTAPFYVLFGYRGLYVIPLLATWIIWLNVYYLCQKFKFSKFNTTIALIILIFSSYLTIYSAMYWEHTLAVCLCFTGITLLVNSYPKGLSIFSAIISGWLIGFSVWFRPEFLCVVGIVSGLVAIAFLGFLFNNKLLAQISFLSKNKEILVASMFLTVGAFFLTNKLIYNHALGIHGIQIVEKISLTDRLLAAWQNFQGMSLGLFIYLPILYFPLLCLLIYLVQQFKFLSYQRSLFIIFVFFLLSIVAWIVLYRYDIGSFKNLIKQILPQIFISIIALYIFRNIKIKFDFYLIVIYLICLIFIIGVAYLVPVGTAGLIAGGKQWGPRFLLILVPIISLVTPIALEKLPSNSQPIAKYFALLVVILLITIGTHKNILQAKSFLSENNQNTLPAIQFLRQNTEEVVAISHQFVGQALEPSVEGEKFFFKVEDEKELIQLSKALVQQQQPKFTYICYPNHDCKLPTIDPDNLQFTYSDRHFRVDLLSLGKFGKYPIYEVDISKIDN
jgi:hypothetical protein